MLDPLRSVIHQQGPAVSHRTLAAGGQDRLMGFWGWVSDACRTVWHGIQTVADAVGKAVDAVVKVLSILVTGDFDWDKQVR